MCFTLRPSSSKNKLFKCINYAMVINLRLLRELTIAAVSTPGYTKLHVTQTTRIQIYLWCVCFTKMNYSDLR